MSLDHAILGFLNFSPMTGYDLKKSFDSSVAHFWSATQSHIYKSLERLQGAGHLSVESVVQDGKPNRKVYQITASGQAELCRWLSTPLPMEPMRVDWLIQVFFAAYLPDEQIERMLEARIAAIREQVAYYETEVQPCLDAGAERVADERIRRCWQITLDTGIAMRKAELELLERTLKGREE